MSSNTNERLKRIDWRRVSVEKDGSVWEHDGTPIIFVDGIGHIQKRDAVATIRYLINLAKPQGVSGE